MRKLAMALLFAPALVMVGSPTKSVQSQPVSQQASLTASPFELDASGAEQKFSMSASAHAAAYPAVSQRAIAMITSP